MSETAGGDAVPGRSAAKSASAFRTISEVSTELDVPQHVLRFWESKFSQVRPLKRGGGRRYYRPEDIELLRRIRHLLYGEGYTIRGVQRLLRERRGAITGEAPSPGLPFVEAAAARPSAEGSAAPLAADDPEESRRSQLLTVLEELAAIRDMLRRSLG